MDEFERYSVVTIQGGGVFGLNLLGQLNSLHKNLDIIKVALAGTSAGAIIAALNWAGFKPNLIRLLFLKLAEKNKMESLLGPFKKSKKSFDYKALELVINDLKSYGQLLKSLDKKANLIKGLKLLLYSTPKLYLKIKPLALERGLFSGRNFESWFDGILRISPKISPHSNNLPQDRYLTFRDISELSRNNSVHFPALFLTATKLNTLDVELFSSFEDQYQDVPIARAVRASAGFPIFFRPTKIKVGDRENEYLDGGIISNFPSWAFTYQYRLKMSRDQRYMPFAFRPWLHFGLRLTDDIDRDNISLSDQRVFYNSIRKLLTGAARNRLEEIISSFMVRSIIFKQPVSDTGGPKNPMDINSIDTERIKIMTSKGSQFVKKALDKKPINFQLPNRDKNSEINIRLSSLIKKVSCVISKSGNKDVFYRANIFLPYKEGTRIFYSINMEGDPDENMTFDHFLQGLTGACYNVRRPYICNLDNLSKMAQKELNEKFNMPAHLHGKVRKDRTWLASVPIHDTLELGYKGFRDYPKEPSERVHHYALPMLYDGPIFGVLNLDSDFDYNKLQLDTEPRQQWEDYRIKSILNILLSEAFQISHILSEEFGRQP